MPVGTFLISTVAFSPSGGARARRDLQSEFAIEHSPQDRLLERAE